VPTRTRGNTAPSAATSEPHSSIECAGLSSPSFIMLSFAMKWSAR
jgi:hypothetical protein